MTKKERKEMDSIMCALSKELIDSKCTNMRILTCADRLFRRTWGDIGGNWMLWSFYMERSIFGGDHSKYDAWAKDNCLKTDEACNVLRDED